MREGSTRTVLTLRAQASVAWLVRTPAQTKWSPNALSHEDVTMQRAA
jgi:hypothetical protein